MLSPPPTFQRAIGVRLLVTIYDWIEGASSRTSSRRCKISPSNCGSSSFRSARLIRVTQSGPACKKQWGVTTAGNHFLFDEEREIA